MSSKAITKYVGIGIAAFTCIVVGGCAPHAPTADTASNSNNSTQKATLGGLLTGQRESCAPTLLHLAKTKFRSFLGKKTPVISVSQVKQAERDSDAFKLQQYASCGDTRARLWLARKSKFGYVRHTAKSAKAYFQSATQKSNGAAAGHFGLAQLASQRFERQCLKNNDAWNKIQVKKCDALAHTGIKETRKAFLSECYA